MSIIKLNVNNLRDVPGMLRVLASDMESGKQPNSNHTIVVSVSDGDIFVYGFGDVTSLAEEVGLLHLAALTISIDSK